MKALGATARGWKSLSLSTRILIGLGLGILAGLVKRYQRQHRYLIESPEVQGLSPGAMCRYRQLQVECSPQSSS